MDTEELAFLDICNQLVEAESHGDTEKVKLLEEFLAMYYPEKHSTRNLLKN